MSRLCAKPTCSDVAERWFDVCAAECEVVERSEPTPSTIAFCGSHAARFSVPVGWAWVALDPAEASALSEAEEIDVDTATPLVVMPDHAVPDEADVDAADVDAADVDAPRRMHTRDAPWFLANAPLSDDASDVALNTTESPAESSESTHSAPSAGSLLHRAFHGPDRDHDVARALQADQDHGGRREERTQSESKTDDDDDVATVRDLASRRSARSPTTSYDVELPFPPVDVEPHVAVS